MQISVSRDPDDKQILALYIQVAKRKIRKTVEIAEGACYVDVDSRGRTVGIEMVAPGSLEIGLKHIKNRIDADSFKGAVKDVKAVVHELEGFVSAK